MESVGTMESEGPVAIQTPEPITSQALTFSEIYAKDIIDPLSEMLAPDGRAEIYPVPDQLASKTLILTGPTSIIDLIVASMGDELQTVQDPALLPPPAQETQPDTPEEAMETLRTDEAPDMGQASELSGNAAEVRDTHEHDIERPEVYEEEPVSGNDGEIVQTYIYHMRHGTASAMKYQLDQLYGGGDDDDNDDDSPSSRPKFIASDQVGESPVGAIIFDPDEYEYDEDSEHRTAWEDIADVPGSLGNYLMIRATPSQYAEISAILEQIDAYPVQVFLNVLIAEVTLLDTETISIDQSLLGQSQIGAGGEQDALSSFFSTNFDTSTQGFQYALLAPGRYLMKLRALATQNRLRLLSNPHIFVRNNRKAKIFVGEDIPVVTTERVDSGTSEKVETKSTGITLIVLPRVHPDGFINLEVLQEVSEVGSENYAGTEQVSITKRKTRTAFDMADNSLAVLGGLISETQEEVVQGIPLLKDIPLLGMLFKSTYTRSRRTELFIIIQAEVLHTSGDIDDVYERVREKSADWLEPEQPYIESYENRVTRKLQELWQKSGRGDYE
jgi:type II secretory pathway component GspD/PulD (secretin)